MRLESASHLSAPAYGAVIQVQNSITDLRHERLNLN